MIRSPLTLANTSLAPTFDKDFANKLVSKEADSKGRVERVFDISCVSKENSLQKNVECLFFPGSTISGKSGGVLREVGRYAGMILVFLYIVYAAIKLLINAKKAENFKEAINDLLYILVGSALFF